MRALMILAFALMPSMASADDISVLGNLVGQSAQVYVNEYHAGSAADISAQIPEYLKVSASAAWTQRVEVKHNNWKLSADRDSIHISFNIKF